MMKKLNANIQLVVMGGHLNTSEDCSELFNRTNSFDMCKDARFLSYEPQDEREKSRVQTSKEHNYLYIDRFSLLYPTGNLESCRVEALGEPMFYDAHHLSLGFATHLGRRMAEEYGEALRGMGFPPANIEQKSNSGA